MKLLFVCKRRPQQRDLLDRPYGRFFHIPRLLAARGHEVHVALLSHDGSAPEGRDRDGVRWTGDDLRRLGWRGAKRRVARLARDAGADCIVGVSDAWTGVLAAAVASRIDARLALDAYDDFEAYMPWNLPLHLLWRRALHAADVVTAAGPTLAAALQRRRGDRAVQVVPMAADPGFVPLPRDACRRQLGLPEHAPLLGYFGGWAARRGTDVLTDAWRAVRSMRSEAGLVVTGDVPAKVLSLHGVIAVGRLEDAAMPMVLNGVDAAAVVTADSRFGRGSHPAKLCEAMACGIPVVATSTPPVAWMLRGHPASLVPVADPLRFALLADEALGIGRVDYGPLPSWEDATSAFERALGA